MRNLLFALSIFLCAHSLVAQQTQISPTPASAWTYSPELSEEELYQYERLLYMSKEDWELFRTDPRYNDARIREIYQERKGKIDFSAAMPKQLLPADDCDCWIEPDNSYTNSDPSTWPNCSGGGPGVDCWIGPINLGFNFCFFGQDFNQIYFTTKGTIAFGSGYFDWTPHEFPNPVGNDTQHDHICGFWADFDFRATGEFFYKVTPEALYVNYVDVGYFANHDDKTNTFQMIITPEGSNVLPEGQNVQFCYRDMQWAHGDVGGSGGFSGPTPTNVGADRLTGNSHAQFGRFNLNNGVYNGPYGQNNNQQDGVNWLDNRTIGFSTCLTSPNIPPIPTVALPCDTITLCQGDSYNLSMQFLSPEVGQNTTITFTQSGTGLTATSTAGNTASLTATFAATAANQGLNTVTITATDNGAPAQSTVLTYVFNVLNETAPPISISGNLTVCAGGSTVLSATPGFDAYEWSSGCTTIDCTVSQSGDVTVTGFAGQCTSSATVFMDATNFFIPDLALPNPVQVCPGTNPILCTADEWVNYFWEVMPGQTGSIIAGTPTDEQCVEVSGLINGSYRVTVTDENGCQGRRIQNVQVIQSFIDPINAENAGAYCNGFEPIEFTGGFSNPASGNFTVYLQSTTASWQGSYITINVTNIGGVTTSSIFTATSPFNIVSVPITGNDFIEIVYTSSGVGDASNFITILNCINSNPISVPSTGSGLTPGVIYSAPAGCAAQPLFGEWNVEGPTGWTLTETEEYNTVFNANQYGEYTLCFTDPACAQNSCYEIEFTETPSLDLTTNFPVLLCGTQTQNLAINVTDIGGTGDISWTGAGLNIASNELSAVAGPYTTYTSTTVVATIENGCGSASDEVQIDYQPAPPMPQLTDQFICNGGSAVLDPIPANQDNPNLNYAWSTGQNTPTISVTQTGTYSVIVSNGCGGNGPVTAEITLVPAATLLPEPPAQVIECTADQVVLSAGVPDGYTITWSTNETTESITVTSSGQYSYEVTDNQNCNTSVTGTVDVTISTAPNLEDMVSVALLCPGECINFSVNVPSANSIVWTSDCPDFEFNEMGAEVDICSANIPLLCQNDVVGIIATVQNACGIDTKLHFVQANACVLNVPDVITPNGDGLNDTLVIEGLENYDTNQLYIFDRWGNKVFEKQKYDNSFDANNLDEGTYFYVLELPFGTKTKYEGTLTVIR
jgi:gliding motility-associated-like protein